MKLADIFLILCLSFLIPALNSNPISISFDTSGTGYTISDNTVTINNDGDYDLINSYTNKQIIVSSSSTLNLNSFSLINSNELTPIIISSNKEVELVLSGESTLQDSSTNSLDGVIYLQSGAKLTISSTGTLNINPNKFMAINGTTETSLIVNDGANIKITSSSKSVGGIYLRKGITFNNAIYTYSISSEKEYHAIDTEGSITMIKGTYNIVSGAGKGIQAEQNLYIGEQNGDNSNLKLTIQTSNEGIEAKGITIYSGTLDIKASEDGINAAAAGEECDETVKCSGNCECYFKFIGGSLTLTSEEDGIDVNGDITISGGQIIVFAASNTENQPIDQDGSLQITGGNIIAAGSSKMHGGVSGTTTQTAKTYSGSVRSGDNIVIYNSKNTELLSLTAPKAASFVYFNFPEDFSVKLNNNQIVTSTASNDDDNINPFLNGKLINLSTIVLILMLLLI